MRKTGILPFHPQRLKDELLSSWIVRLARANDCKVHTLCSRLGGNRNTVWNRDIDRLAPAWLIEGLAAMTGKTTVEIERYTLRHLASLVDGKHNAMGTSRWILPLGVWHRKRKGYGAQFCPLCFRFDKDPYIRASWRLAYYTECEHHHRLLLDRCPNCGEPLAYFRSDLGKCSAGLASPMNICTACGTDLGYSCVDHFEWPEWQLTVAIRTIQLETDFGWADLGNRTFERPADLLRVVRNLIRVLESNGRGGQLYDEIAQRFWPNGYHVVSERGKEFERRSVEQRHRLFGLAVWLLLDWPDRLFECVRAAGLCLSDLTIDAYDLPDWFVNAVQNRYAPNRHRKVLGAKSASQDTTPSN